MIMRFNQQGVALIQVLLVTGIMTVLALYLSNTAKEQVTIAQLSNDKAQGLVNINSAQAEIMFTLFTESKQLDTSVGSASHNSEIKEIWNFHNEIFTLASGVQVKVQDQSGLINIHYPETEQLKQLLEYKGLSFSEANAVIDNLLDWQDVDSIERDSGAEFSKYGTLDKIRNGMVPDISDFKYVNGITPELLNTLYENTTMFRKGNFNPMNSPETLLNALVGKTTAERVLTERAKKTLTRRRFKEITGLTETDEMFFITSNYLSMELINIIGQSRAKRRLTFEIQPYAEFDQPVINILSNRD